MARIVDSHAHVAKNWYEPLETLRFHLDANAVARAVLTQPLGQTDNSYIQTCRHAEPERYATIVLVDPAAEDAIAELQALAADGAAGVRLRPTARSPRGDGLDVWRAADAFGLAVSSPGTSADFASEAFAGLVSAFPDLTIVLEHLAAASAPDANDEQREARRRAFELSRFPNVYAKVPGLGELVARVADRNAAFPFAERCPAVLREALAAFGAGRLMWGSDFPVVASREGYANALALCRDALADCSEYERALIFGGVADVVFPSRP